jgi:uncharacterized RDD family membrane protein YckC
MEELAVSKPWGAICAHHDNARAVAICSRCGSYICSTCHQLGADGKDYCFECDQRAPELGERSDRFVANFVDNFIIFIPIMGAGVAAAIFSRNSALVGMAFLLGALATLGVLGYQVYLAQYGQSIGKRMRRLRVVRTDGSPASLGRILLLRNFVPWVIGSFCGFFGLIDALVIFTDERRCIHDLLADTKVIKVNSDTENL